MSDKLRLKIAKLCDDSESRTKGLMKFRKLRDDECAFFIFPSESAHPFWNKNVSYDLDLACLNNKFEIECFMGLEKESADPVYPSNRNIKYVIEANKGIFDDNDIEEGDFVDFDPEEGSLIFYKETSGRKKKSK